MGSEYIRALESWSSGGRHHDLAQLYEPLLSRYQAWLGARDQARLARWQANLAAQPEGAIFEACAWRALEAEGLALEALPEGRTRDVDFRCTGRKSHFYVEATVRDAAAMTSDTGVPDIALPPGDTIRQSLAQIGWRIHDKREQARQRTDAPVLVASGSLHWWGAATVAPLLSMVSDPSDEYFAFEGADEVSGFLWLSPVATAAYPSKELLWGYRGALGLANPCVVRPFDTSMLPHAEWIPPRTTASPCAGTGPQPV